MMRRLTTALILALCFGLSACAHDPSASEEAFGDAYNANREAMIENPGAGWQEPSKGIDARTAEHVLENYSEGQEEQEHRRPRRGEGTVNIFGTGQ